jgi:hypothetical protein
MAKTKIKKPDKVLETAIGHVYYIPDSIYRHLPRHNRLDGGCSQGKLYPLPSDPERYAVCLKCGTHIGRDLLKHYKITFADGLPNLKELR